MSLDSHAVPLAVGGAVLIAVTVASSGGVKVSAAALDSAVLASPLVSMRLPDGVAIPTKAVASVGTKGLLGSTSLEAAGAKSGATGVKMLAAAKTVGKSALVAKAVGVALPVLVGVAGVALVSVAVVTARRGRLRL